MGSYRDRITGGDYEVTSEQKATHRHILEHVVPARKDLAELTSFLDRHAAIDRDEAEKLRDALRILDGFCIPMALLKEVEDPRAVASARMFSSMLRSRRDADDEETIEVDEAPSMRP